MYYTEVSPQLYGKKSTKFTRTAVSALSSRSEDETKWLLNQIIEFEYKLAQMYWGQNWKDGPKVVRKGCKWNRQSLCVCNNVGKKALIWYSEESGWLTDNTGNAYFYSPSLG